MANKSKDAHLRGVARSSGGLACVSILTVLCSTGSKIDVLMSMRTLQVHPRCLQFYTPRNPSMLATDQMLCSTRVGYQTTASHGWGTQRWRPSLVFLEWMLASKLGQIASVCFIAGTRASVRACVIRFDDYLLTGELPSVIGRSRSVSPSVAEHGSKRLRQF